VRAWSNAWVLFLQAVCAGAKPENAATGSTPVSFGRTGVQELRFLEFFKHLFSLDFMPHGYCYLWSPWIVWLNVISDALITLSYYCIPIVLIYIVRKRGDLPFNRVFWMFGAFILACGTTHLIEIWNIWHASYFVAGLIKLATAGVSVVTAVSYLACFSACTAPKTSKAGAWAWPRCSESSRNTMAAYGQKRNWTKARLSISRSADEDPRKPGNRPQQSERDR
jgi:hypothetical protein